MDTPSPCISRCLADPSVTHLLCSECRCPVRRSSQEKRLPILQNTIDNPDEMSYGWDSGNPAFTMPGLAAQFLDLRVKETRLFEPCYCPFTLSRSGQARALTTSAKKTSPRTPSVKCPNTVTICASNLTFCYLCLYDRPGTAVFEHNYYFSFLVAAHMVKFKHASIVTSAIHARMSRKILVKKQLAFRVSTPAFRLTKEAAPKTSLFTRFDTMTVCTTHFTLLYFGCDSRPEATYTQHSGNRSSFISAHMIKFKCANIMITTINAGMSRKILVKSLLVLYTTIGCLLADYVSVFLLVVLMIFFCMVDIYLFVILIMFSICFSLAKFAPSLTCPFRYIFPAIRILGLMGPPRSLMTLEAESVIGVPRGIAHQHRRHFPIL